MLEFKKILKGDNFKNLVISALLLVLIYCWNLFSLSEDEKRSAKLAAYTAVEELSNRIPCNGINLLAMNMVGDKNREFLAEEVRNKVQKDLRDAYAQLSSENYGNRGALFWWYSEREASNNLDAIVERCYGL